MTENSRKQTGILLDDIYLQHDTGPGHPERPDRLRSIVERLHRAGLIDQTTQIASRPAKVEELMRVHTREMIDRVRIASARGPVRLDADTTVSHQSYQAALRAAGGLLACCDAVMRGDVENAFAIVRPPGHHAERDRSMGFCLFNNVAVAARDMQERHGLPRIAIIDWDVHHGNGTQHIFDEDPSVFYASLHQHPLYPGTGMRSEEGRGEGIGTTLNIPLPSGSDDDNYARAFEEVERAVTSFQPDAILVSAGYDAHHRDPLASMSMTEAGFALLTDRVRQLAHDLCDDRLIVTLEGGYDLDGLSGSVVATVERLMAD